MPEMIAQVATLPIKGFLYQKGVFTQVASYEQRLLHTGRVSILSGEYLKQFRVLLKEKAKYLLRQRENNFILGLRLIFWPGSCICIKDVHVLLTEI